MKDLNIKKNIPLILIGIFIAVVVPLALFVYFPKDVNLDKSKNVSESNILALENTLNKDFSLSNVINASVAYINGNKPGKAVVILNKILKKDSTNAIVYNNLGTAQILLKNYQLGIEACKKAIELDPKFTLAKNNLKWGNDEALKVKVLINQLNGYESNKKDAAYYVQLGIYHLELGQYDSCIQICETGILKHPDLVNTYLNNIGTSLVLKKQFHKAIDKFNAVLLNDPNNQLAKNNILWANSDSANLK